MDVGLVQLRSAANPNGLRFLKNANYIGLKAPSAIAASFDFILPNALPDSVKALTIDSAGNMDYATLSNPLAGNQAINTVLAGPATGSAAPPTFRGLAYADLSAIVGTGASNLAAGNDSRFHTQGTDIGTTSLTFALDSDGTPLLLKNNAGILEVRNAADTAYANIVVGNVTVQGTTTTIASETVTIDDNILVLNNNYTGSTPTESAGLEIERGTLTSASFLWDESSDRWMAGLVGSEIPLARKYTASFTNASLTSGVLTVTHNLAQQYVTCQVYDNANKQVLPDEITLSSTTALAVDLTSFGTLSGTYNVVVAG